MFLHLLAPLAGCAPEPPPPPVPQVSRAPLTAQVAVLRIRHDAYAGRELFIDGRPRGPLPVDATLPFGPHRFEILVGPGERLRFDREVEQRVGIQQLDLAR